MTARRRLAVLLATLTTCLLPSVSISAQSDDGDAPPSPISDTIEQDQGNEVVHSWALAPAGTDEAGGIGNRPDLSYVTDPGTVIEDAVTLFNLSNVPLVFQIYATDAFNNEDGEFDLLPASATPTGAGSWVDLGAEQIPLEPRTQVTIPITITIPENATPGDHAGAILAANAAQSTGPEGQRLTLDRRTGTQVFVRINGPLTAELAIADVQTDYSSSLNPLSGSAEVTYTVENRGNVNLSGTTQVSIGGPFGIGKQTAPTAELPLLLPGESVTLTEGFDGVAATGVVVAEVQLDPSSDGDTAVASTSRSTTTLALPIAVLLALLIALFGILAVRAYRRHQARDEQASITQPSEEFEREHQPT